MAPSGMKMTSKNRQKKITVCSMSGSTNLCIPKSKFEQSANMKHPSGHWGFGPRVCPGFLKLRRMTPFNIHFTPTNNTNTEVQATRIPGMVPVRT